MSIREYFVNEWKAHKKSFRADVVSSEGHPKYIVPIVSMIYFGALCSWLFGGSELKMIFLPIALGTMGSGVSLAAWYIGPNRMQAIAVCQVLDVIFLGTSVASIGLICNVENARYMFIGFYAVMCLKWASERSWTMIGFITAIIGPLLLGIYFRTNAMTYVFYGANAILYRHVSNSTKTMRQADRKIQYRDHTLRELDTILNSRIVSEDAIGIMMHEIKNLLGPIGNNLVSIVEESNDPEVVEAATDSLSLYKEATSSLSGFLALLRGAANTEEVFRLKDFNGFNYGGLTGGINGWRVESERWPDLMVVGREACLKGIMRNLVKNAAEAGATLIKVYFQEHKRLNFGKTDTVFVVCVEDNGNGLPPPVEANLFKQYMTHGKQNGNGLGMWLSKRYAESMNGELLLSWTRRGEQHGTCFEIRLSVVD